MSINTLFVKDNMPCIDRVVNSIKDSDRLNLKLVHTHELAIEQLDKCFYGLLIISSYTPSDSKHYSSQTVSALIQSSTKIISSALERNHELKIIYLSTLGLPEFEQPIFDTLKQSGADYGIHEVPKDISRAIESINDFGRL